MKRKVIAIAIALVMAVGFVATIHNTGIKVADGTITNSIDPPDM